MPIDCFRCAICNVIDHPFKGELSRIAARGPLPVVTAVGAHRDIVVNRGNGMLVKAGAPVEFADAIVKYLANFNLFCIAHREQLRLSLYDLGLQLH